MNALADPRHLEAAAPLWLSLGFGIVGIVGFVIGIGIYIWYALALSRLFPRLGAEGWKGWVPVLNEATILQLGGKPAWNVVFYFLPIVQLYGLYLKIVATHQINGRFGRGAGSTVLAVLLPPVWATLLAWGAPPYPENDRLAGLQPGPRRQPQPGADAAPYGAPQAYLAPPILPPGAPVPPAPGAHAPSAPGAFAPAPPAARPPALGQAPQQGGGFVPQVAPVAAPAPSAVVLPVAVPDQLIDSVPGFGAQPSPSVPPPPAAPGTVPAAAEPTPPVADPAAQTTVPAPAPAPAPGSVPTPALPQSAVPAPSHATVPTPASTIAPVVPAQAAPPPPPAAAAPAPPQRVDALAPAAPVPAPAVDSTPIAAAPEPAAEPAPAASDALFAPPPQLRGSGLAARAASTPGIRPAPVPLPMPTEPVAPASVPTIFDEPETPSPQADDDDIEATVVVSRRRGARRVLVLDDGRTFALSSTSIVIGRNPEGDSGDQRLSIPDKTRTLSKTHARLVVQGDEWRLTDLHSTNGVVVVADDGAETLLDQGESVIGAGRFILGEVGMHVELESDS